MSEHVTQDFRDFGQFENHEIPHCPRCGTSNSDADPISLPWSDGDGADLNCSSCGKDFYVVASATVRWSSALSESHADDDMFGPQS